MGWVGKNSAQGFSEMYNKVLDIFGDENYDDLNFSDVHVV